MTFKDMMFLILIVTVLADLLILVILGFKYPGYNHFYNTISTLGTNESQANRRRVQTFCFIPHISKSRLISKK